MIFALGSRYKKSLKLGINSGNDVSSVHDETSSGSAALHPPKDSEIFILYVTSHNV